MACVCGVHEASGMIMRRRGVQSTHRSQACAGQVAHRAGFGFLQRRSGLQRSSGLCASGSTWGARLPGAEAGIAFVCMSLICTLICAHKVAQREPLCKPSSGVLWVGRSTRAVQGERREQHAGRAQVAAQRAPRAQATQAGAERAQAGTAGVERG